MVNARRSIHHVPELPHDYSQGVPNLMSPGGFSIAWTEYMKLMVEKLNALTVGMCSIDVERALDYRNTHPHSILYQPTDTAFTNEIPLQVPNLRTRTQRQLLS
jgi:superoxide dismutase